MSYQVKVQDFVGPLDLLLHLIRKNELDIYTISVSEIANQYLEYVEVMQSLNLDGVGEFLLMAATLAYHKSKMLLPSAAQAEDEEDEGYESLEELHRRLIEYQRYKEAAQELHDRELLNRDVYKVNVRGEVRQEDELDAPLRASLFDLLDAFQEILKTAPKENIHEVMPERIKLVDRIVEVLDLIVERKSLRLEDLFQGSPTRSMMIVTFLALLELIRMQMIRAYQLEAFGPIKLRLVSEGVDVKKRLKESLPHHEL